MGSGVLQGFRMFGGEGGGVWEVGCLGCLGERGGCGVRRFGRLGVRIVGGVLGGGVFGSWGIEGGGWGVWIRLRCLGGAVFGELIGGRERGFGGCGVWRFGGLGVWRGLGCSGGLGVWRELGVFWGMGCLGDRRRGVGCLDRVGMFGGCGV